MSPKIETDKQALLSTFFNNLLDNYDKYCPNNSQVEVTIEHKDAHHLNIILRDNGPGIA